MFVELMNSKMQQQLKQIIDTNGLSLPIGVSKQFYF